MIRRAGEHGLLVETGALEISHRLDAALRAERPPEVLEVVPGPETVLVVAPGADQGPLRRLLAELTARCRDTPSLSGDTPETAPAPHKNASTQTHPQLHDRPAGQTNLPPHDRPAAQTEPEPYERPAARTEIPPHDRPAAEAEPLPHDRPAAQAERPQHDRPAAQTEPSRAGAVWASADVVTIPVVYDGADLDSVAEAAGVSVDEVVARHTGRELVVGWLGFAPGFAYLIGLDPVLHVPRLATPRTSVPAGSVAIAGPYSAVYPSASPGGWRLLGRTDARVWDVTADPPTPFRPGTRVRFEAA